MYSHTIAIARCLLLEGRTREVVEMLTPLLNEVGTRKASREAERMALLRCLLAQANVLGESDVETVKNMLSQFKSSSTPNFPSALSLLWLGWAHVLDQANPNIPQAINLLRSSHQQLHALHRGDYLYWAQIGHAIALSRLGQHSQMQDLIDEIMTCTSFARDELAQTWMRTLLKDDLATWCKNSQNVMKASYSTGAFLKKCKLVAEGDAPLLFTGERGVGKESTGRLIHEMKGHTPDSFLCINCEALSSSQYPFTLPLDQASGLHNGVKTIFLNHVDALPPQTQVDLLARLDISSLPQNGQRTVKGPRFFAATSTDIDALVREGTFDTDLYNHLQINRLHVAPLRSRTSDIPLLALHYAHHFCPIGVPFVGITEEALTLMLRYTWPGNVRQLRNEIERAISYLASEPIPVIDSRVLPEAIQKHSGSATSVYSLQAENPASQPLEEVLAHTEKQVIENVLASTHGQVSASASRLGLTRQGLYKKIKRLGILVSNFQDETKRNPRELRN